MFHVPNKRRIRNGYQGSTDALGNNGCFLLPHGLFAIASDGLGWEHVSVSTKKKTPTWAQMCLVKNLFWDKEDVVIQYHPPKKEYVNNHEHCLHMWRPIELNIPVPDSILVGIK